MLKQAKAAIVASVVLAHIATSQVFQDKYSASFYEHQKNWIAFASLAYRRASLMEEVGIIHLTRKKIANTTTDATGYCSIAYEGPKRIQQRQRFNQSFKSLPQANDMISILECLVDVDIFPQNMDNCRLLGDNIGNINQNSSLVQLSLTEIYGLYKILWKFVFEDINEDDSYLITCFREGPSAEPLPLTGYLDLESSGEIITDRYVKVIWMQDSSDRKYVIHSITLQCTNAVDRTKSEKLIPDAIDVTQSHIKINRDAKQKITNEVRADGLKTNLISLPPTHDVSVTNNPIDSFRGKGMPSPANLGRQVAIWKGVAVVSTPDCSNTADPCAGGYFLTFTKDISSRKWLFFSKTRSPYQNHGSKFATSIELNKDYLMVCATGVNYMGNPVSQVVLYRWMIETKPVAPKTWVKDSVILLKAPPKDYDGWIPLSNTEKITAIGQPDYDSKSQQERSGSVLVFEKGYSRYWRLQNIITSPTVTEGQRFGHSISLKNATRIVVSAYPASDSEQFVYVFDYYGTKWTCFQILRGGLGTSFGWKIGFHKNNLYVSDPSHLSGNGAIFVFEVDFTGQYSFTCGIHPSQTIGGQRFGFSFAFDEYRMVVGTRSCDDIYHCNIEGAAYLFSYMGKLWVEQKRFTSSHSDGSDGFGYGVAVGHDSAIVSAPYKPCKGNPEDCIHILYFT